MKKLPKVLTEDEARALIGAFNLRYDSGVKNRCMVRLMLEGGLRVSEVVNLKVADLDLDTGRVRIRDGKGGRDRMVWIPESLCELFGVWLERRPKSEEGWAFPTRTGRPTDPRSIRRTVKTYAEKAGIREAEEVSPHTLRHTFATTLYKRTCNIRLVQKALGHSDLSTTMIYTHIVDNDLEAAGKAMTY